MAPIPPISFSKSSRTDFADRLEKAGYDKAVVEQILGGINPNDVRPEDFAQALQKIVQVKQPQEWGKLFNQIFVEPAKISGDVAVVQNKPRLSSQTIDIPEEVQKAVEKFNRLVPKSSTPQTSLADSKERLHQELRARYDLLQSLGKAGLIGSYTKLQVPALHRPPHNIQNYFMWNSLPQDEAWTREERPTTANPDMYHFRGEMLLKGALQCAADIIFSEYNFLAKDKDANVLSSFTWIQPPNKDKPFQPVIAEVVVRGFALPQVKIKAEDRIYRIWMQKTDLGEGRIRIRFSIHEGNQNYNDDISPENKTGRIVAETRGEWLLTQRGKYMSVFYDGVLNPNNPVPASKDINFVTAYITNKAMATFRQFGVELAKTCSSPSP